MKSLGKTLFGPSAVFDLSGEFLIGFGQRGSAFLYPLFELVVCVLPAFLEFGNSPPKFSQFFKELPFDLVRVHHRGSLDLP